MRENVCVYKPSETIQIIRLNIHRHLKVYSPYEFQCCLHLNKWLRYQLEAFVNQINLTCEPYLPTLRQQQMYLLFTHHLPECIESNLHIFNSRWIHKEPREL